MTTRSLHHRLNHPPPLRHDLWFQRKCGVRANALFSGGVFTGRPEEFVQRLTTLIPMRRMAEVNENRAAIPFLCSDASRAMTGQYIVVDSGRSVL